MKLKEIITNNLGIMTLKESDVFISEMANFLADITELPANIVLWTEPNINDLPHDKYRIKIYKDRVHCCTMSISANPVIYWESIRKKLRLTAWEKNEVKKVISNFSSLFIQYVDNKISSNDLKYEIKKINGIK
jgi:Glu-tRNA(Gln) amidotransferase subunit E-like FAD-binding protein